METNCGGRAREAHVGPPEGAPSVVQRLFALSADELLWAKLNARWRTLDDLGPGVTDSTKQAERRSLTEHCRELLCKAQSCLLCKRRWWSYGRNSDMFWALVHEADEELVALMDREQLATRAMEIEDEFERTISDQQTRSSWLVQRDFPAAVKRIVKGDRSDSGEQLGKDRRLVRGALHVVNEKADWQFWQLAMNARIRFLSALELIGTLLIVLAFSPQLHSLLRTGQPVRWGLVGLLGVGALGALLSNMLSGRKFNVPYGPTQTLWGTLYYLLVVPLVGASAGVLLCAFARSGIFFAYAVTAAADRGASVATYTVIAAIGGFLGEQVLGKTAQRAFGMMFREASKDVSTRDLVESGKQP
jgi:hypothetical protein